MLAGSGGTVAAHFTPSWIVIGAPRGSSAESSRSSDRPSGWSAKGRWRRWPALAESSALQPVTSSEFIKERLDANTVG
jgi:hypothetical protein